LDPPPAGDPVVQDVLAAISATRYGRASTAVDADREALLERIAQFSRRAAPSASSGEAIDDPDKGALPVRRQDRTGRRGRSQNRPSKTSKSTPGGADGVQLELEGREPRAGIERAPEQAP
jgi:hypothetical protein